MVWLIDSAGARIDPKPNSDPDQISLFAGSGHLFREQVVMSGVVPQVAAMVGPGAAGTAYIPGLADFVPMVAGKSSMALGGPALVKAMTNQDITEQELGGSRIHCEMSGVGDVEVETDERVHRGHQALPVVHAVSTAASGRRSSRATIRSIARDDALLDIVPDNTRKTYDMYEVIRRLVDRGEYLDIKPKWARR